MKLNQISKKYNYTFPAIYQELWNDGMLDWYKGWDEPWSEERNWHTEVYPTITDDPPLLLHTGGFDFQLLRPIEILDYEFYEWWDDKHTFIPFAQTNAGDLYAFYKNIEIEGENPIVMVWHDENKTEILAKNFEDFIFRKMVERIVYIDKDDIKANFDGSGSVFQMKISADLKSVAAYLKPEYVEILDGLYNRSFENVDAVLSEDEMKAIFKSTIDFPAMSTEFGHEIE